MEAKLGFLFSGAIVRGGYKAYEKFAEKTVGVIPPVLVVWMYCNAALSTWLN